MLPAFNSAETLPAAAASLQAQTLTDWHAVIVNDGSTDRTLAIATDIAKRDERFVVYSQANRGVAAARNAGLSRITGRYTLLLDADDTLMPNGLAQLLAASGATSVGGCGSYGDFVITSKVGTPLLLQRGRADVVGLREVLGSVFFAVHAVLTPTPFAQRIMFDPSLPLLEDTDWFLRLAEAGVTWRHTSDVVANYRISPDSRSADFQQMLAMSNLVYGAAYRRQGLDATEPMQLLLVKATLSYFARAILRSAVGGTLLKTEDVTADLGRILEKFGRPPAISGRVIGHLTATACAMGACRRPRLDGTVGEAVHTWLAVCSRVGILNPGQESEAWRAIESRQEVLKSWCEHVSQSLSAATP